MPPPKLSRPMGMEAPFINVNENAARLHMREEFGIIVLLLFDYKKQCFQEIKEYGAYKTNTKCQINQQVLRNPS